MRSLHWPEDLLDKVFVPLAKEMQIVRAYLEVEQFRLGNRLRRRAT